MTDNTDGHAILDSHAIGRKYGDVRGGWELSLKRKAYASRKIRI